MNAAGKKKIDLWCKQIEDAKLQMAALIEQSSTLLEVIEAMESEVDEMRSAMDEKFEEKTTAQQENDKGQALADASISLEMAGESIEQVIAVLEDLAGLEIYLDSAITNLSDAKGQE